MHKLRTLKNLNIKYSTNNYYDQFPLKSIKREGSFHLSHRNLLSLKGVDSTKFLQSYISNDINKFNEKNILNAVFMNTKGRVICESIITKPNENEYWIECDENVIDFLKKHLLKFKLRSKITIEEVTGMKVYSSFEKLNDQNFIYQDPRNDSLGFRIYSEKVDNLNDMNIYDQFRIMTGVCEGVKDVPIEDTFPSEINFDFIDGISYNKGCYLGQELTARTHFSGLTRKRCFPIYSNEEEENLESDQEIYDEKDKKIGSIKSTNKSIGIAKIKFATTEKF
eukprot:gene12404-6071_t